MSAKTSPARTEAFFAALAATGNQTLAAGRARVSRSWVTLHRSADPAFKARMEACIAAAREAVHAAQSTRPDKRWAYLDGEELVVRGTRGRRAQVARARLKQWTASTERDFLRALAASGNVRLACREVGLSVPSAYVHRSKFQAFADNWEEAIDIAQTRLEMALLETACNSLKKGRVDPDGPLPLMSFDDCFRILRANRKDAREQHSRKRWRMKRRTLAEVQDSILRKLDAIDRHEALEAREPPEWLA